VNEVGLPAEEGGDLQNIDVFSGDLGFLLAVYVRGDRYPQFLPDLPEEAAALGDTDSPKAAH
jgi:hypothetical protein